MLYKLFNSQTKGIGSAAVILGVAALISRLLGLFRDRLLAGRFGAGEELDIYFAAFRIPDFIYGLIIMGGISAAFLPIFSEARRKSQEEGWKFVNNTLGVLFIVLAGLCGLLALTTPLFIRFIVPGFSQANLELIISLTRIMFLSPVLLGISSIFSGVLQYFQRFFVYSLAPVLYNIGIIFGIIFFVEPFGLQGLAFGVILGAFLHMFLQVVAVFHTGWLPHMSVSKNLMASFKNAPVQKLFRLALPRIFGVSAYHINLVVITAIASTLGAGAIAVFNFSNNLQYLPIGLIGVSFATAAFTALSRSWAEGDKLGFARHFSSSFRQIFFLVLPVALLMILLRAHIVRVVLGTGQFSWEDTRLVAASLALFAPGILAAALVPLLARAFFALQDTKTPALISLVGTALNVGLALFFARELSLMSALRISLGELLRIADIQNIAVIGLPLAISLAAISQTGLLSCFLFRRLQIEWQEIMSAIFKMVLASFVLIAATYILLQLGALWFDTRTFWGIFWQGAMAGIAGLAAYFAAAFLLKLPEAKSIFIILKSAPRINGL